MPNSQTSRSLWILTCGRIGDLKQMQALAAALGWPAIVKSPESLAGSREPLPDLLLCAERKAAAVALALKKQSRGQTKLVCLARPRGHFDQFDLIITTPQYELANAPNVMEVSLPLTDASSGSTPSKSVGKRRIALLVGGSSPPYVIDAAFARDLAARVKSYVAARKAMLTGTTSARTDAEAIQVLKSELASNDSFHVWERGKPNPYATLLAQADEFIVTADSVSMLADGIAAGKPVAIFRIAERWGLWQRIVRLLWSIARQRGQHMLGSLLWPLFDSGLLEQRANRQALYERLVRRGAVRWFDEGESKPDPDMLQRDMASAVVRVKGLFES